MSEEKLFDVNWDQRKWETPASAQDMKLYSYPPRTIRNMSVPGFLTWLVLLLASIGGLLYTAWMTVTGDYEDGKINTILGVVSFVVLLCCLIYKTNYKRKLITYTDVLHAVLIDKAKHAYVVHLNEDAFLGATGLGAYRVQTVQAQGISVTHVGQAMDSRDMEQKAIKMIQHKDFLLKRIQEKPAFSGDDRERYL